LRRLISPDFESLPPSNWTFASVIGSSVLFGAMHGGQWFAGILAGLLYAVAYVRKGRMGDAVMAHAVTNALIAVRVLMTNEFGLW